MLPPYIGTLVNVNRLVLERNALTDLPAAICALTALKTLVLDSNRLTALPDGIGALTRLDTLSLAGNRVCSLPDSMGGLLSLKVSCVVVVFSVPAPLLSIQCSVAQLCCGALKLTCISSGSLHACNASVAAGA